MTQSEVVKTLMDAATLVGLSSAIGWVGRKVIKEPLISDPSSNIMNYVKWVGVMSLSIYIKEYLVEKKVIPNSV